jgi:glutathionylspermidine synthase
MKRIEIDRRPNWEQQIKEQGFLFYKGYYDETAAYEFNAQEVDNIEAVTTELFDRCLDVVQHVIDNNLWDEFFIPRQYADLIKWSWENDNPAFYGRFDLAMDNECRNIKLLEFNADTPTSLLEASVIQWYWLQDYNKNFDQFNSIHEKLVDHMKVCRDYLYGDLKLYFAAMRNSQEDYMTVKYLQDCATQANVDADFLFIDEIGIMDSYLNTPFCAPDGSPIRNIFKLYPYEWLFNEKFGPELVSKKEETLWIEPAYKAILSNKMLLVYLHKLFPDHPNILPAFYSKDTIPTEIGTSYAKKPVYGREGNNVSIVSEGVLKERANGEYGEEGFVFQEYFPIPQFNGRTPVIGSWLIGGVSAGMGIKETTGLVHGNMSKFTPHYFTK